MDYFNDNCAEGQPSAPFGTAAPSYYEEGLSIFPCGGDNGKKPVVRSWNPYKEKQVSHATLDKWLGSRSHCNIAIITGALSGVVIVDSDNSKKPLKELISEFGETPLIATTPSGGYHLYYRYNGEKHLIGFKSKIDILGEGGYAIAPPSKGYGFVRGSIKDIKNLPVSKMEFLHAIKSDINILTDGIKVGERNKYLFKELIKLARKCDEIIELEEHASAINTCLFEEPLPKKEIANTVKSVWKYKITNSLMVSGEGYAPVRIDEILLLSKPASPMVLFSFLKFYHEGVRREFRVTQKEVGNILGWTPKTVRKYIKILMKKKLLFLVKEGGYKKPNTYSFTP